MTEVSLREHFESEIRGLERLVEARLGALEEAVKVAKENMDFRLAGMNEFRAALEKQADEFARVGEVSNLARAVAAADLRIVKLIDREMLDSGLKPVEVRLSALERNEANLTGRLWAIGAVWAVLTVVVPLAVIYLGSDEEPPRPMVVGPAPPATVTPTITTTQTTPVAP